MRVFLVRHGETDHNLQGIALGRADVPLNDTGLGQAARLAGRLEAEPLTAVYSSPLQRALNTARAIAAPHGVDVSIAEALIEMDIGDLDGLTFPEIRQRHPELMALWASPEGQATAIFGSESLTDVGNRAWRFLETLHPAHQDQTVCLVTHNFVILSLLTRVLGMDLSHFRRLRHAVAAVSTLDVGPGGAAAISINDTCHLDGPR